MENLKKSQLLGLALKYYRKKNKLSQSELADMLGIAPNTICKYEKEGINDINMAQYIGRKLKVDLFNYNGTDEMKNIFEISDIKLLDINECSKEIKKMIVSKYNYSLSDLIFISSIKKYIKYFCLNSEYDLLEQTFFEIRKAYPLVEIFDDEKMFSHYYNLFFSQLITFIINVYRKLFNKEAENINIYISDEDFIEFSSKSQKLIKLNDIKPLISEVLSIELDSYDRSSCYFLMKACLYYLVNNIELDDKYKNIENLIKLLFAAKISDNDPDIMSPLEKIFSKLEFDAPNNLALKNYKSFKFASPLEQKRAIVHLLYAIDIYLNHTEKPNVIFNKLSEVINIPFKPNIIVKKSDFNEQIFNLSSKSNVNNKNYNYNDLKNKIVNDCIERVILKKGDVIINERLDPTTGETEFDYNIE